MHLPEKIIDLTDKTPKEYRGKSRPSAAIDAIVLHQMSFNRGNDPDRYKTVKAHFAVLPNGQALQLHPADVYLAASSAFNDAAIAIEFAGNFRSDRGKWWSEKGAPQKDVLGRAQIFGGRDLVTHLQATYGLSFIFAHRQGEEPNRRGNCPGPEIWYQIGEWAIRELGMSDGGRGYREGKGGAIPDSWRRPHL
jgi:hypothetical protein